MKDERTELEFLSSFILPPSSFAFQRRRGIVTGSLNPTLSVPLSQVAVQLRPEDNVAVAARNLSAGTEVQVNGKAIALVGRIGLGHKLALKPIKKGEAVLKYGQI